MARKRKRLDLSPAEYALVHRILITTPDIDSITAQRSMNDLLDDIEALGGPKAQTPEELAAGMPPAYEVAEDVVLDLSNGAEATLRNNLLSGIKRFQAWVTRPLPGLLDRLESLDPVEVDEPE